MMMSEEEILNQSFLERYDRGEAFDEWERKMMAFGEVGHQVDDIENGRGRWRQEMVTVFEIGGRYFAVEWECGLTERQENEYDSQPVEVRKHEYEKTFTVTEWIPIVEDDDEKSSQN